MTFEKLNRSWWASPAEAGWGTKGKRGCFWSADHQLRLAAKTGRLKPAPCRHCRIGES